MIVAGVVVHCCTGCRREATVFVSCPGGGLYFCDAHAPHPSSTDRKEKQ